MDQRVNGKALKFRALAETRVSRVLGIIRRIGNLSRRGSYEYSDDQVEKMFDVMRAELDAAENKFKQKNDTQQQNFRFD